VQDVLTTEELEGEDGIRLNFGSNKLWISDNFMIETEDWGTVRYQKGIQNRVDEPMAIEKRILAKRKEISN